MKKNHMNLSILLYYINLLVLISNSIFFYVNLTELGNGYGYFIMPIITCICFFVSKYLKEKLELSGAKLYVQNCMLFLNIIISLIIFLVLGLLIIGLSQNITH